MEQHVVVLHEPHRKNCSVMAMKELFRDLRPFPLYVMLGLTLVFFTLELIMSHVTHALTLLVDSYHTLCNLIALTGCLIAAKYGSEREHVALEKRDSGEEELVSKRKHSNSQTCPPSSCSADQSQGGKQRRHNKHQNSERRLRNTFGWARVEVLVMLISAVFLASLCFSLIVEAVQTLFHIGHSDEMHHPIYVMIVGVLGLLLNGFCYFLIGGYRFQQGSLLHMTPSGDVVLDELRDKGHRLSARRVAAATSTPAITTIDASNNEANVSVTTVPHMHSTLVHQGPFKILRDLTGCMFVIVCANVVLFTEQGVAKYVDPVFSIASALLLLFLNMPYMKESGRVLLQTIPDYIDIESLKNKLVQAFPSLVNVHEVHIWCLTPARVYATVHLVFKTHQDYVQIKEDLDNFIVKHGITHATIQPEFYNEACGNEGVETEEGGKCYLQCSTGECRKRGCCGVRRRSSSAASENEDDKNVSCFGSSHHGHSHHGHRHNHGHSHHKTPQLDLEQQPTSAALQQKLTRTQSNNEKRNKAQEVCGVSKKVMDHQVSDGTCSRYSDPHRTEQHKQLRHQRSLSAGSEPTSVGRTKSSSGDLDISQVRQHSLEVIPLP